MLLWHGMKPLQPEPTGRTIIVVGIAKIAIQIVGLQTTTPLAKNHPQTPVPLKLPRSSCSILDANTGERLSDLHRDARKILDVLQKELMLQLFADNSIRPPTSTVNGRIEKSSVKAKQKSRRPILELYVVLYGPPTLFDHVGLFTARCNLFLQHPRYCDRNVPYKNPQCLTPRTNEITYTYDLAQTLVTVAPCEGSLANPIELFTAGEEQARLEEADTPLDLISELYRHQKQALTFLLQREEGWALDGRRKDIWTSEQVAGRLTYINTITSQRQTKPPPPFRGGLLIDAPGLGKSLSVIALIAAGLAKNPDLTTLLVVPKTCK